MLPTGPPLAPALNLALDELLLSEVAAGSRAPSFRLWEWDARCVIIGSHQSIQNEVDLEAASSLGFTVWRRMSGGGAMIVEPEGSITWSIYSPISMVGGLSFADSYAALDAWAVRCLRSLGVPCTHVPLNDIATPRGKLAGSAQARRRGVVLHHTVLAYAMDTSLVRRLLRVGRPRVSARGIRSAEKEVSPLDSFISLPRQEVMAALQEQFAHSHGAGTGAIGPRTFEAARKLADSKYAQIEWIARLP